MKAQSIPPVQLAQLAARDDSKMAEHDGIACLYGVEIDRILAILELEAGLFGDSINDPSRIPVLAHHDPWSPIGKATRFKDSKESLHMDFALDTAVQAAAEMSSLLTNEIVTGLSVGFDINRIEIEKRGEGPRAYEVEVIKEATLKEVSCVVWPAIEGARVQNGKSIDPDTAITFSVLGVGGAAQERLQAGDHMCLATFARSRPHRIRPRQPLSEDEQYPQLRAELNRILAR